MNDYQENILENYKNPKNYGEPSFAPTHSAKEENLNCGDSISVFLNVQDNILKDISFIGEGCSISIGAMSILCDEIKGKHVEEILKYSYENELKKLLGIELTMSRIRCANLGLSAVKKALSL